jgi:hypothetical protein
MPLPRRPRFVWATGDLTMTWPCRAWIPEDSTVGSRDVSASGIPAAYIVRRDDLLNLTQRVTEDEWSDFRAFIAAVQDGQAFQWYPDAEEAEFFDVYLESPAAGDKWRPSRDGEYPRMFEATIQLRGVDEAPWLPYFDG